MILSCNSCEKKFVVPDQAITADGRIVQCGACGNKWKQFPIEDQTIKATTNKKISTKKTLNVPPITKQFKTTKKNKKQATKVRETSLYSPEYLKKKHGISLDGVKNNKNNKNNKKISEKVSFGFYNSLILFIVIIIALSKSLHFSQEFIIQKLPVTEFYFNYFFESIKNIYEIWKNLISNY
jgi:predicted Zn finger-like uncharacterized protein